MRFLLCLVFTVIAVIMILYDGAFVLRDARDINLYEKPLSFIGDGVGVYIVNLKQHTEKYHNTYLQLSKLELPIHRIDAIDGKDLSDEYIHQLMDLYSYQAYVGHNPRRGSVGCYLSHVKAWQEFLKSDYEFALIAEDDIFFEYTALKQAIEELIGENNKRLWDINLFNMYHRGLPMTIKKLDNDERSLSVYLLNVVSTGAYIINRNAAYNLLKKALPIRMPIDRYFLRGWELGGIVATGIEPRIVGQTTNISYRKSTGYVDGLGENDISLMAMIHRKVYIIKSDIIKFVYNLGCYITKREFFI